MTNKLTNNNKIQVVALRLNKDKLREYQFRLFLDQNNLNGINRKETILRMFEYIYKNDIPDKNIKHINMSIPDEKMGILKLNTVNTKINESDWNGI